MRQQLPVGFQDGQSTFTAGNNGDAGMFPCDVVDTGATDDVTCEVDIVVFDDIVIGGEGGAERGNNYGRK